MFLLQQEETSVKYLSNILKSTKRIQTTLLSLLKKSLIFHLNKNQTQKSQQTHPNTTWTTLHTPWKISMEPKKIAPLKTKIIWTKPSMIVFKMLIFQGVYSTFYPNISLWFPKSPPLALSWSLRSKAAALREASAASLHAWCNAPRLSNRCRARHSAKRSLALIDGLLDFPELGPWKGVSLPLQGKKKGHVECLGCRIYLISKWGGWGMFGS